ncbi:MAG: RNase H-like domain-containing protein [Flavobacteriales bacterium]
MNLKEEINDESYRGSDETGTNWAREPKMTTDDYMWQSREQRQASRKIVGDEPACKKTVKFENLRSEECDERNNNFRSKVSVSEHKFCDGTSDAEPQYERQSRAIERTRKKISSKNELRRNRKMAHSPTSGNSSDESYNTQLESRRNYRDSFKRNRPRNIRRDSSDESESRTRQHDNTRYRRKNTIQPEKFDGSQPLVAYLQHFDTCATYNEWQREDKAAYLRTSLRGNAALLVASSCNKWASYREIVQTLTKRYGTDGQTSMYRAQLKTKRRGRNESLQELYHEITRLIALAYPGEMSELRDAIAVDAFLESLDDDTFEIRIRDRQPKNLDEAFRIALTLESYTKGKSYRDYGGRVRMTSSKDLTAANESSRMTDELNDLKADVAGLKRNKFSESSNKLEVKIRDKSKAECFNCGKLGHFARECRSKKKPKSAFNRSYYSRNSNSSDNTQSPGKQYGSHFARSDPAENFNEYNQQFPTANSYYSTPYSNHSYGMNTAVKSIGSEPRQVSFNEPDQMLDRSDFAYQARCNGADNGTPTYNPVYLPASVEGTEYLFLLDSGCEATIMPASMISGRAIRPTNRKLFAANGTEIDVDGETEVCIGVRDFEIRTTTLVSRHVTEPMLSIEWLSSNQCNWDFHRGVIEINGASIELRSKTNSMRSCRRLTIDKNYVIEPWTEKVVGADLKLNNLYSDANDKCWMTGGREIANGVFVAHSLIPDKCKNIPVRIMNTTEHALEFTPEVLEIDLEPVLVLQEHSIMGDNCRRIINETCSGNDLHSHIAELIENIPDYVTGDNKTKIVKLLQEYQDVFSRHEFDLGETNLIDHEIITGDAKPVRQSLRRHPVQMLEKIDEYVDQLLGADVIKEENSPWASNIVLVRKKDGSVRFTVDYRQLNEVTRKDTYPLPRIDECLDALSGAKYYSTFDLRSGFFQIKLNENSSEKTCFITRKGSYSFKRLPQGLCNSSSSFQRVMNVVMRGLNYNICLIYLDDIIIFSSTIDDHLERLKILFQRLRDANLKLKPSKCQLMKERVEFLGHVVSEDGVETNPEKIKAIIEWPTPTTIKHIRQFLGLCSYYRRFIPEFAAIAAPLHSLTGKGKRFAWGQEQQVAFDNLKTALTTSPVLALPTDDGNFILDVDASQFSIGAVLSQIQSGEERVIAYSSRLLNRLERNYCVTRKELLAFIFYLKKFRQYLLGRRFLARTDHAALQWLRKTPEPIGQQARWLEIMEEFDFSIQHRSGNKHINADSMSRIPQQIFDCDECSAAKDETRTAQVNRIQFEQQIMTEFSKQELATETANDTQLAKLIQLINDNAPLNSKTVNSVDGATKIYYAQKDRIKIHDGIIYRKFYTIDEPKDVWQVIPPVKLRNLIIDECHGGWNGGHFSNKRTCEKVRQKAYWVGWRADVINRLKQCEPCAKYHRGSLPRTGELQTELMGEPWERISIDVCGPFPKSSSGYKFILTVIDSFSKWAFAFAIRNHEASTIGRILVEKVFAYFGVCKELLSDCAPEFEGRLFQNICSLMEIKKLRTSGYKPSTNGAIERFHRTLNSMLGKMVNENQRNWDELLPHVMAAYRATPHSSTSYSPNFLILGHETRAPIDLVLGSPPDTCEVKTYDEFTARRQAIMEKAYALVRTHLGVAAARQKARYDLRVRRATYNVGDWVWFYYPRRYKKRSPKWQRMYFGPYLIIEVIGEVNLKIQKSKRMKPKIVHVDKVKRYYGNPPISWLKDKDDDDDDDEMSGDNTDESSDNDRSSNHADDKEQAEDNAMQAVSGTNNDETRDQRATRPRRNVRKPARFRD